MFRKLLVPGLMVSGLALLALAAPASAATFKWANDGDVRAMDPYTLNETVQNSFLQNIYEPLVRHNRKLELEPALATSWQQKGPTTWTFHLRPGVKWQDGGAFTADDVLFSVARDKSKTSSTSTDVASIKEARKIDDLTVEFETFGPDPILPSELTNFDILSKAWCEKNNATDVVVIGSGENYATRNAMGTGPYRLGTREPDRRTTLERNAGWWDKPEGNADHVEFTVIGNAATRVAALLSGEMDMIYSVPPQDMARLGSTQGIKLIQGPELRTIFLGFDTSRPELLFSSVKGRNPFQDVRVRRAFALAIDEPAIARAVMRGQARPSYEMWGPGVNGFNEALNARPATDPAKAKALLAEAGYPNGFTVTLDCPNDRYVNDEGICTAISAMMAKVGVKVEVYARTKVKYFAETGYPNFKTSFFLLGWTPATYDAHNALRALLHTRDTHGNGLNNDGQYSNPDLDRITDQIGVELDQGKRQALIDSAIKLVQDQVPVIPLHQQTIVWAARNNIDLTQPADNTFPMRWVTVK